MKKIKYIYCVIFFSFIFSNNLNIISYNVHGFPGKKNYNNIVEIINNANDFDLLFIQENWKHNNIFLEKMKDHTFIFNEKVDNSFYPSGLMIGIKKDIDLIEYDEKFFSVCNGYLFNGSDCLASKGFIYLKVDYKGSKINIINTHLDSGSSTKDKITRSIQLQELRDYINYNKLDEPLIMCGDFNIDLFKDEDENIKNFIYDLKLNFVEWSEKYFLKNKIDYIFYTGFKNIKAEAEDVLYNLSDHPPMRTILELIK